MMRHHSTIFAVLLALGCSLLPGCRTPSGEKCALNSDCPSEQICHPALGVCAEIRCEGSACVSDITETQPDTASAPDLTATYSCETDEKPGWRVTVFEALEEAEGRSGVDVDGDPATCAPTPCDDGYDNGFVKVSQFNIIFASSIKDEDIAMAFYQSDTEIQVFDVQGGLESGFARVLETSFDSDGILPISSIPISSSKDGAVSAENGFMLVTLLVAGIPLVLPVEHTSIQGTFGDEMDILIGGAIAEEALKDAVFAVPPESLPDIIPDHETLMGAVKVLYTVDVDMDETEGAESISINLHFQGTPAQLCFPN